MSSKPITFVFEYEYNTHGDDEIILDTKYVYWKRTINCITTTKVDNIIITKKAIKIKGERSKENCLIWCLKKTSSAIYQELVRSIVFAYMTQGRGFTVGKCSIITDNNTYDEDDFGHLNQPCSMDLQKELILPYTVCKAVFYETEWAVCLLRSLSEYIVAVNTETYDDEILLFELWKAFNTLYSFYYECSSCVGKKQKSEHLQLEKISECINDLPDSSLSICKITDYKNDILSFRVKSCFINMKAAGNTTNKHFRYIKNCILKCKDKDLLDVFYKTISGDAKHFELSKDSERQIEKQIKENKRDCIKDYLRFTVITYGYFLRCKYFHGEKSNPTFIIKDNKEARELELVTEILKLFIIDLYKYLDRRLVF